MVEMMACHCIHQFQVSKQGILYIILPYDLTRSCTPCHYAHISKSIILALAVDSAIERSTYPSFNNSRRNVLRVTKL